MTNTVTNGWYARACARRFQLFTLSAIIKHDLHI